MLGTQRQMFLQSLGIRKEVSNLPRTLTESAASCQDQSAESGPETTARYGNANISHIHISTLPLGSFCQQNGNVLLKKYTCQ